MTTLFDGSSSVVEKLQQTPHRKRLPLQLHDKQPSSFFVVLKNFDLLRLRVLHHRK